MRSGYSRPFAVTQLKLGSPLQTQATKRGSPGISNHEWTLMHTNEEQFFVSIRVHSRLKIFTYLCLLRFLLFKSVRQLRHPFLNQCAGLQEFADWVPTTVNQCVPRARANRRRKIITAEANRFGSQIDGHLGLRLGLDNFANPAEIVP